MKKNIKNVTYITGAGIVAACYAALTLALSPFSFGFVQVRVSEALVCLCLYYPFAVPGITLGCFISGILGPNGIIDAVVGTAATLIGCIGTRMLRKYRYAAPLFNVISNAVIVGLMLCYFYDEKVSLAVCILSVGAGELVSCVGLGSLITVFLEKNGTDFFKK